MAKHIVLVGGGSGGHVVPNIALIKDLKESNPEVKISYIGEANSFEQKAAKEVGVSFYAIKAGKLRRYWSWQNFLDVFNVIAGFFQSLYLLLKVKPTTVFAKGGYVCLPVGLAAFVLHKRLIIHESDLSPGLTTKVLSKFAQVICVFHEDARKYYPQYQHKLVVTGNPIRFEITTGSASDAYKFLERPLENPIVLVMGGSLGARSINTLLWNSLEYLQDMSIVHITGQNEHPPKLLNHKNYVSFEYVKDEMPDLYAVADVIVSRAGAGSISEIIATNSYALLLPLSSKASRGDQVENAQFCEQHQLATWADEYDLSPKIFAKRLRNMIVNDTLKKSIQRAQNAYQNDVKNPNQTIINMCLT